MLPQAKTYEDLQRTFRWDIPDRFNIGVAVTDAWAQREPDRPAILDASPDAPRRVTTYGELSRDSNRLAHVLRARGVKLGDRVAVLLPQSPAVAVSHAAIYKLGAIALPLAALFGIDALDYRFRDAGAKALITNAAGLAKVAPILHALPGLETILSVDGPDGPALGFHEALSGQPDAFEPVDSSPDDPALMIYTSGTTGNPKGALHAHRVLLGHLPGVEEPHEFLPQPGDKLWTPADWAWAGGLLNIMLPGLFLGVPVVARKFDRFDPEEAFALLEREKIRNAFVPPTALRMMRAVEAPGKRFKLDLRTLASGGESLGAETYHWGREELGLTINEFYGQTECNLIIASCAAIGVSRAGAMGKAVPGHDVAVIREDGSVCEPDETGQIAVRRPDPVMFLDYWGQPEATQKKFIGDWMTTGDQGAVDSDGYIRFIGRDDDVITSSGYRIGPGEIEDCLLRHPAVRLAAVVGKPDPVRTEIVKAFIVPKAGVRTSPELEAEIRAFVRTRLSAHEYPREVEFVAELPMTTTGKIIRRLLRDRP